MSIWVLLSASLVVCFVFFSPFLCCGSLEARIKGGVFLGSVQLLKCHGSLEAKIKGDVFWGLFSLSTVVACLKQELRGVFHALFSLSCLNGSLAFPDGFNQEDSMQTPAGNSFGCARPGVPWNPVTQQYETQPLGWEGHGFGCEVCSRSGMSLLGGWLASWGGSLAVHSLKRKASLDV